FEIPDHVRAGWDTREAGARAEQKWNRLLKKYEAQFPSEAAELRRRLAGELPEGFDDKAAALAQELEQKAEALATRKASQNVLEVLKPALPELLGGSADLTGSNLTMAKASKVVSPGILEAGNHIFYGVREFGMCAMMNGITLHGGFIPYGGTFLVFSDY